MRRLFTPELWLAMTSFFYPLSAAGIFYFSRIFSINKSIFRLLIAFLILQIVPVIFGRNPTIGLIFTLFGSILIVSIITIGINMDNSRLKLLTIYGLGVNVLVGVLYSLLTYGDKFPLHKIIHPLLTSPSVGLYGVLLFLFAIFANRITVRDIMFAILGIVGVILSQSRSAAIALICGLFLGFVVIKVRSCKIISLVVPVAMAFLIALPVIIYRISLESFNSSGRDTIWFHSIELSRSMFTGIGSYQLGRFTSFASDCQMFPSYFGNVADCPTLIKYLHNPQIISHNIFMNLMAEVGLVGTISYLFLIVVGISMAIWRRDALRFSIIGSLMCFSINDNANILPGPIFSTIFWLSVGGSLNEVQIFRRESRKYIYPSSLILILPLLNIYIVTLKNPDDSNFTIQSYYIQPIITAGEEITVVLQLNGNSRGLRLIPEICNYYCYPLNSHLVKKFNGSNRILINSQVPKTNLGLHNRIRILIYPAISNYSAMPLKIIEGNILTKSDK